jgi:hypothetical protein
MRLRRTVAEWSTRGGRYWLRLYHDGRGYGYDCDNGGGWYDTEPASDEEAIAMIETRHIEPARRIDGINLRRITNDKNQTWAIHSRDTRSSAPEAGADSS